MGSLDSTVHSFLSFYNPYPHPINTTVSIDGEHKSAFQLFGKSHMITQGQQTNQITFSFSPKEIKEYFSMIEVRLNPQISWKFPIKGISEYEVKDKEIIF